MIDGGAHLGGHTETMLRRSGVKRVYAIEAIPRLCQHISKRFSAQDALQLVCGAIGRETGRATFRVAVNLPGYSGLVQRKIAQVTEWEEIPVDLMTLDDVVAPSDATEVGLIKLDLEGGEFHALCGARRLIARSRPLIVFENGLRTSADSYGYDWSEFEEFMTEMGYEVWDFFGNRVDRAYWDAVLQTYMFVALPSSSDGANSLWLRHQLPAIVTRRANGVAQAS